MRNDHQEIDDLRLRTKLAQTVLPPKAAAVKTIQPAGHTAVKTRDDSRPYSKLFEKAIVSSGYNFFRQFETTFQLVS